MKWKNIKAIFAKEIVGAIRDKRTLVAMIIVPLIFYPFLFIGIGYFSQLGNRQSEETVSKIILSGGKASELLEYVKEDNMIDVIESEIDLSNQLKSGEIHAIIEVPYRFDEKIKQGEVSQIIVKYDATEVNSRIAQKRVYEVLENYMQEIVLSRLIELDLSEKFINPFIIETKNMATSEKVSGAFLGFLLPYLIIILIFAGAMHTAIDITTGEKERGTIATLLVSQISRIEIILGKCLSIMTVSFTSMLLGLFGISISLLSGNAIAGSGGFEGLKIGMTFQTFFLLFFTLLPLVGLTSAVLVIVGIYARNIKEASSYVTPIYMLTIFLAVISISQGIELKGNLFLIPILNSSFTFKEILMGKIYWNHIIITFMANTFIAGIALIGATRLFNKEEVLFRS